MNIQTIRAILVKTSLVLSWIALWFFLSLAVYSSPDTTKALGLLALAFSFFSIAGMLGLWVFVLSKHLSTHSVRVMDLATVARAGGKQDEPPVPVTPDEKAQAHADLVTSKLFGHGKGKVDKSLTDHISYDDSLG